MHEQAGIPEPPKKAKTTLGDLWLLGGHRLLCGDSTNIEHVNKLMDGKRAALCATDSPYLVDPDEQAAGDMSNPRTPHGSRGPDRRVRPARTYTHPRKPSESAARRE